jgi:hypothetical protein
MNAVWAFAVAVVLSFVVVAISMAVAVSHMIALPRGPEHMSQPADTSMQDPATRFEGAICRVTPAGQVYILQPDGGPWVKPR